jgi:hypothetical protein|tara:strand:+ start:114 stop:494 length:381 start_codon:yes stop_codon:yes gene_type:complete
MNIKSNRSWNYRVGLVLITGLLMLSTNAKAQIINVCEYDRQSNVNVYYTKWKHEADIVVMMVDWKWQAQYGMWWIDEGRQTLNQASIQPKLSIYETKYKHNADFIVYRTKWKHEVRVTWEFIDSSR